MSVLFCGGDRWQTFRAAWLYWGGSLQPQRGDSPSIPCHGGRADLCRQCEPPPWIRPIESVASPLWSGREVRVARRERFSPACRDGGRSTMDAAGGEDNSGVTLNTPFTEIQFFHSPSTRLPGPSPPTVCLPHPAPPFPAAVALPVNNPPTFKFSGRILLETNRRSIRRD